ncbi:MAG: tRNA uridine-5-carboxymethylaminomethyl(34) synthesis enzyme MnmG, partial [Candidatus Cloacimonetes bacterium]|nr:tRNA uridine-5-carboxymethylaminomethyl(34) synthesis enzyme MnmG [Candidatus Cloacimonadota bacterium]
TVKQRELQRLHNEKSKPTKDIPEPVKYAALLKRPEITIDDLTGFGYVYPKDMTKDIATRIELEIKYEGYLKRQQEELQRFVSAEKILIPDDIDFMKIKTIAWEAREKLARIKPHNIGQAMRIPGVNYSDTAALMIWLRKNSFLKTDKDVKD